MNQREYKGIIAWFVYNPVAANCLMLIILLGGFLSMLTIEKQKLPEFEFDKITIQVAYPGATPFDVERGICIKIEEIIEGLEGIKQIESIAEESFGTVTVEAEKGYDLSELMDEINFQVSAIFTFPEEVEEPIVKRVKIKDDVIDVQLLGDLDEMSMTRLVHEIHDEIKDLPEIKQVEVNDARAYEVAIELSEDKLQQYGLSFDQIVNAIRNSSLDLPGGVIRTDNADIRLRTQNQAYTSADFEKILLLKTTDGARVILGDVANVIDGFEDDEKFPRFNKKPSISMSVYSVGKQSDFKVTAAVRDYVKKKNKELPESVYLATWADESYYLKGRLKLMIRNLAMGAILVFALVGFFLRLKLAFWVIIGVPVSFMGTLWLMPWFDESVNMVSIFGFILVLGILVDDAIVIGENVYSTVEREGASIESVIKGAREVALPATFGVLTTIAAFIPTLMVDGTFGIFTSAIGLVVILSLIFSLIESKWILPSHLANLHLTNQKDLSPQKGAQKDAKKESLIERIQQCLDLSLKHFVEKYYEPFLQMALKYRYLTLSLFISLFIIILSLVIGGAIRFVFFPNVPSDYFRAELVMASGTPQKKTLEELQRIEDKIFELDQTYRQANGIGIIENVRSFLSDHRSGKVYAEMYKKENRKMDSHQFVRKLSQAVGSITGADSFVVSGSSFTGVEADIAFELTGNDLVHLQMAGESLSHILKEYEGVFNVKSSFGDGNPEIVFSIKPEAEALGLTLADIGKQIRQGFYGAEAQRIQRNEDEVKVMVRYPKKERLSLIDLQKIHFRTTDGRAIPFSNVVEIQHIRGYQSIKRIDGKRTISITASADKAIAEPGKIAGAIKKKISHELSERYPDISFSLSGQNKEESETLDKLFQGLLLAFFIIYALMAIPLRSYVQPLLIMSVIPFGFIGAVLGHWLMGIPLSIFSFFGIIALSGVVVNDSLVMVYFVNRNRAKGIAVVLSACNAGKSRFRAILLTSLTTFMGLIPIIFEQSMQAKIVIPMAVSLAFGILFSTVITLILIPILYAVMEDIRTFFSHLA